MKSTCDLYDDFLEEAGTLPAELRHFGGRLRFHGPAQTVKCFEDNSKAKALCESAGHGRVLVVDAGSSTRHALIGDLVAGAALTNGWAGIVIMGAVRDSSALKSMDFGILALGATPRKSVRNNEGQVGITVRIGDVRISEGDYIVVDEDGALCFRKDGPQPEID